MNTSPTQGETLHVEGLWNTVGRVQILRQQNWGDQGIYQIADTQKLLEEGLESFGPEHKLN